MPADKRALVVQVQPDVIAVVDKILVDLRPSLRHQPKQRRPIILLFFGMLAWTPLRFDHKGPV